MRRSRALLAAPTPFLIFTLALGLLCASSLAAAEATRTLKVELSGPASGPFAVENLAGIMRITGGSGSGVVAVATVHAESDELAASVRFEQVSGKAGRPTLRVRYPLDRHSTIRYAGKDHEGGLLSWFGGGSTSTEYDDHKVKVSGDSGTLIYADVEVQVPKGTIDAVFRNVVGPLSAKDLQGTITVGTNAGDQTLERLKGTVVADTGSGDITATDMEGSLKCDTGSGDAVVKGFTGERLACDTGSGDITIRSARTRIADFDTGSGNIQALDLDGEEFSADTGSGDVELQATGRRLTSVKADTGSGDVVLRLGPDASFEARADQGSGEIVNRYPDAQPIVKGKEVLGYRRGDGRIRITVDTGSGDLVLDPGTASARKSGKGV